MPITEPVTSQYDPIYWVRLLFFPILVLYCIYSISTNHVFYRHEGTSANQNLVLNIVLSVLSIVFYRMVFIRSFPKKVVVTVDSIMIDEYAIPKFKHVIIKYADIKETGTYRQTGSAYTTESPRFSMRAETLNIELHNGETYEISENDFQNYNKLKSAIYDHLFRHK